MNEQNPSPLDRVRDLEAAGEYDAALTGYAQLRRYADAGRIAFGLGRLTEAARYYQEAAHFFEAAACHHRAGDSRKCLEMLLRVPKDHPAYRKASLQVVRIATEHRLVDYQTDHFLSRYLAQPPADEHDLDAFERLAKYYESERDTDNAREMLQRIVTVNPNFRDASRRLNALARASQPKAMDDEIARQDVAFHNSPARLAQATLPELPGLPPAPSVPPAMSNSRVSRAVQAPPRVLQRGGTQVAWATPDAPPPQPQPGPVQRVTPAATTAATASGAPHSMPASDVSFAALSPGTLLGSRYQIEKKIGEGGMASVYRARDVELDELIAIKVFQSDDPQFLSRFKQEVTLSRQLSHPNVIRLYDIGTYGRMKFLTMELLEGRSLDVFTGKPMEHAHGLKILLHACAGLGAAHARGIVHRDLKPANIFLTRDGTLKLMDFGIAKRQNATASLTVAGFIAGTPAYMAPEQINNFARATPSSDLYSLGVMAYEMFTGEVPFDHEDLMTLLMMHIQTEAPALRARAPNAPASVEALVAWLLQKDPAHRPQSCDQLAQRIKVILAELAR